MQFYLPTRIDLDSFESNNGKIQFFCNNAKSPRKKSKSCDPLAVLFDQFEL
jgi:hypothetical protein